MNAIKVIQEKEKEKIQSIYKYHHKSENAFLSYNKSAGQTAF